MAGAVEVTDAELCEMALAADPTECLADDAEPLDGSVPPDDGPLPGWYMPAPRRVVRSRRRTVVTLILVAAFLVINALGFCITYGVLEIAEQPRRGPGPTASTERTNEGQRTPDMASMQTVTARISAGSNSGSISTP